MNRPPTSISVTRLMSEVSLAHTLDSQWPTLVKHSDSLVLSLSPDVLQLAMGSMSPSDLLTLRSTARLFQRVIDGPQSEYIWGHAFRNVKFEAPIDVPYSPLKIAALAFGGGECYAALLTCAAKWMTRGNSCAAAVTSKATNQARSASRLRLLGSVSFSPGENSIRSWRELVRASQQPCHADVDGAAWMERLRLQNGKLLYEASTEYREKKVATVHRNHELLTRIAGTYGMTFSQLVSRSPTLARQVNAFSRDLKSIDTVWQSIRKDVLAEVIERVSFDGSSIPCPFCAPVPRRRLFGEKGLNSHIAELYAPIHREHVAEEVQVPKMYRCSLCPARKEKVFNRAALRHHIRNTVARHYCSVLRKKDSSNALSIGIRERRICGGVATLR
ncbi:hypothetical protein R3P38DRAFT_3345288 [Favolaschia claudopus]|uniref:F-box domain-containing protein n=1 Tax=Favolaschia claudopus TaxID=2862362 RepID=A0AAW0D8M9_9AGAR